MVNTSVQNSDMILFFVRNEKENIRGYIYTI